MDRDEVLWSEHHAAAQSLKNAWTRLAATYGCMKVVLSGKKLVLSPHWFAKWPIFLLRLDLNHEIPLARITGIAERGKWRGYGKVELHFQTAEGRDQKIVLYLKKHHGFMDRISGCLAQEKGDVRR